MTLLRASARTLLASSFVASGLKAVRHPEELVPAAEPVTDKLVPLVQKYAPAQLAGYLPEDTQTLVRLNGIAQVVGGLALATGKGRRLGAVVLATSIIPTTLAAHPFWALHDPAEKTEARARFLKNVSLLGGVLLAAGDTEGRPSLVYRAQKGGAHLARDTRKATKKLGRRTGATQSALSKNAENLAEAVTKNAGDLADTVAKSTSNLADGALAGGAALVGAAVATSRKARKQAAKQAKQASVVAAARFKEAQEAAARQAKIAQEEARKRAAVVQKEAAKRAVVAQKAAAKDAKRRQKKAGKVKKNIKLGEN